MWRGPGSGAEQDDESSIIDSEVMEPTYQEIVQEKIIQQSKTPIDEILREIDEEELRNDVEGDLALREKQRIDIGHEPLENIEGLYEDAINESFGNIFGDREKSVE